MRPLTRIAPALPAHAMQTYQITAPPDLLVVAACEQAGCLAWRYGWATTVDEGTDLGRAQAAYIRGRSARTFRETRGADGLVVFRFDARQRCFAEHRTRPQTYTVELGDWRAHLGRLRIHQRPEHWVEDFAEHQDRLAIRLARG